MTSGRLLLLLAAVAIAVAHARAAPLDADSCAQLKEEHGQLELAGAEADMAKGPEWAIVNLAPEKLKQIQRFIEVEELLLFRCRDKSLVELPLENDPAPTDNAKHSEQAKKEQSEQAKKKAAPKAKKAGPEKKAPPKPARKPRQTKQGPAGGSAKLPAKAATKPAPAAKKGAPKVEDEASSSANK